MKIHNLKTASFDVHIPNLDGDGIAETIPIAVQAYTDPETGEDVLTPESLELIESTQARHMGLMSSQELRALRERLHLTQEEMSDLLQIGAKTYTRWESGRARPSRALNVTLCALRDGQLDVNYLRALRKPSSRKLWSSRERVSTFFEQYLTQLADTTFVHQWNVASVISKVSGQSPSAHWILCHDVRASEGVPAKAQPIGTSNLLAVLHRNFRAERATPEVPTAPRLPSSREQRQTFLKNRIEFPPSEDPVLG